MSIEPEMARPGPEEQAILTAVINHDAADGYDRADLGGGLAEFKVTCEELKSLMELRKADAVKALEERFGDVHGLVKELKSSANAGILDIPNEFVVRREKFGRNYIPPKPPKKFWVLVWEALEDTILRILIVAALISLVLGMVVESVQKGWIEGFAILVSVAVVALVTATNDWQKEKQFRALQSRIDSTQTIATLRGGQTLELVTTELVVGDVCQLKYGDLIPADGIILQSNDLKVDESSLTGESDDVKKGDRDPVLLSGTHVMEGSCKYIVTAVGPNSQSGIIFALLGATEHPNKEAEASNKPAEVAEGPDSSTNDTKEKDTDKDDDENKSILQNKLTKLAVSVGWGGVGAAIVTTLVIIVRFCIETYAIQKKTWDNSHLMGFLNAFITGVTIMVVAIPEGLPLAVTIALAYSVKQMLIDNNLVRHLDACETMGNATAICSDKTGTLTTNRMTVVQSYLEGVHFKEVPQKGSLQQNFVDLLCRGISLNSSYASRIAQPESGVGLPAQLGNKTECALLGFVLELGEGYLAYRDEVPEEKFVHVYTFNSVRKSMSTVVPMPKGPGYRMFTKGASEMVLSKCNRIVSRNGDIVPFTVEDQEKLVMDIIEPMASDGLRTIAMAYRDFPADQGEPDWENEAEIVSKMVALGIVGIEDPVRPEVPAAIRQCQRAGITVRMITGDNVNTARSIALKCGILRPDDDFLVIEGKEFNKQVRDARGQVCQELVDKLWPQLRVMARSSPQDKYTLVNGIIKSKLSKNREIVAVTGDGTNDGPALKKADVGFAMGIQGTDVAKEACDIILTDDNFTSIVKAVMWGRNVYDSIAKFIQFQLTVNLVAITTAVIGAITVRQSPLSATQLLWVNLIMDSFASLALATERPTPDLLERKPYGRTKPLISRSMLRFILGHSLFQLAVMFALCYRGHIFFDVEYGFGRGHGASPTQHLTIVFNTFVMMQLFNEINARKVHGERNVFGAIFTNKLFIIIMVGTLIVQIILVQFTGRAFMLKALDLEQWMWCVFLGFSELIWGQVVTAFPKVTIPKWLRIGKSGLNLDKPDGSAMGRVLWMRSLSRLQSQIRVVRAFQSNLDANHRTLNIISPAVFTSLVAPVDARVFDESKDGVQHVNST